MNDPKYRQQLGKQGEQRAALYYHHLGFEVVAMNQRTPYGEIDLIVCQANLMIFVEVKTRSNSRFGYPETGMTAAKQKHFRCSVEYYLQTCTTFEGNVQLDVLAIQGEEMVRFENVSG